MMKMRILPALLAAAIAVPGMAFAAGGDNEVEDVDFSFEGPFGTYDKLQLQRGFQVYHEVCRSCHGLKYLAFRDLGRADGTGFPEAQIKAFAAEYEVADTDGEPGDTRPAKASDLFPANKSAGAPDLTLMAKARAGFSGPSGLLVNQFFKGIGGPEYIYSILTKYTGEEKEVAGSFLYENKAMPGGYISMGPPLSDGAVEYTMHMPKGHGEGDEDGKDGHAAPESPEATVDQMAKDVSAFLMWAAEPTMTERRAAGFRNLLMILVLAVLLFYTNKKLWAPVKRKD